MASPLRRTLLVTGALLLGLVLPIALIQVFGSTQVPPASNATAAAPEPESAGPATMDLANTPSIVFAANDDGDFHLYGIEPDGSGRTDVATDSRAMWPQWSHDGHSLAFVGESVGINTTHMAVMIAEDEGEVRSLTARSPIPSTLSFGPGDEIYFESTVQTTSVRTGGFLRSTSIDVVGVSGGNPRTLLNDGSTYQPSWSADGSKLAYISVDPSCIEQCTQQLIVSEAGEPTIWIQSGIAAHPVWSPDNSTIAYSWSDGIGASHIMSLTAGGVPHQLTFGDTADSEPVWSPDGSSILFTRDCDLWLQPIGPDEPRNLTDTPEVCEISPTWRPTAGAAQ